MFHSQPTSLKHNNNKYVRVAKQHFVSKFSTEPTEPVSYTHLDVYKRQNVIKEQHHNQEFPFYCIYNNKIHNNKK